MKKNILYQLLSLIVLLPLKKIIELILENPYFFKIQQKLNNYQVLTNEFKDYLNIKNKKILEVGCSTGNAAQSIINMNDNDYYGIDTSEKYIQIASQNISKGKFYQMDASKLDFKNQFFDMLLISSVLHHMDDQTCKNCFNEAFRVLKNNGKVIISEPIIDQNRIVSKILCKLDRGNYIRTPEEYKLLFMNFSIEKSNLFRFGGHSFCSFVLNKDKKT